MSAAGQAYDDTKDITRESEIDAEYASRTGQSEVPVTKDEAGVDSGVNPETEDSDATLSTQILFVLIR